jgi:hypothetical protein
MSTKEGEDENQSDQSFFDLDDDDDDGLEVSLKADGQNSLTLHIPQLGLRGVQTVCPNPTWLNTNHNKKNAFNNNVNKNYSFGVKYFSKTVCPTFLWLMQGKIVYKKTFIGE